MFYFLFIPFVSLVSNMKRSFFVLLQLCNDLFTTHNPKSAVYHDELLVARDFVLSSHKTKDHIDTRSADSL